MKTNKYDELKKQLKSIIRKLNKQEWTIDNKAQTSVLENAIIVLDELKEN